MRRLTEEQFETINEASPFTAQPEGPPGEDAPTTATWVFGFEDDEHGHLVDPDEVAYWGRLYWPSYKEDIEEALGIDDFDEWIEGLPDVGLRIEDYARQEFNHPAEVNWTAPEQVSTKLFASVHYDLKGNKELIEWMSPIGVAPVDPYGERFTGDVVIRERRYTPQGVFGPSGCVRTFVAIRKDGTDGPSWTVTDVYAGLASSKKGRKRRNDVLDRLTLWMGAAATAIGSSNPAQAVSGWANTYAAEIAAFRDGKGSLLSEIVSQTTEPFFQVPVLPLGVLLAAPDLIEDEDERNTLTLQSAIVRVLRNWPL